MKISEAHFVFTDGINVLYGDNGEGKTSVFEAIRFLLTDAKRAESWKDYIKNDGSKEFDLKMSIQMSDKESDIISFHYKGQEVKGSVDRDIRYGVEKHTGADASEFLKRMLDQDMIENTAFSLQDGVPVSNMQPAKRREIFKKIFNSEFPETIEKITLDKDAINLKLSEAKIRLLFLQGLTYQLYRLIEIDETELNSLRKELQESQASEIDKERLRFYSEKVKELNAKQSDLTVLLESKASHQGRMDSYKKQEKQIETDIKIAEDDITLLDKEITSLKETIAKHNKERQDYIDSCATGAYETIYEMLVQEKSEVMAKIEIAKKHMEAHLKGECETCGQKTDISKVAEFGLEIDNQKMALLAISGQITLNRADIKAYNDQCKVYENRFFTETQTLNGELNRIGNVYLRKDTYKNGLIECTEIQIPREQEMLESIETNIFSANEKIKELQTWCDANKIEIKSDIRSVTAIQKEIDSIMESITQNTVRTKMNEETLKKKDADKKEIEQISLSLNTLQLKVESLSTVKRIFEIDFPSYINLQACEILQSYMNTFFKNVKTGFTVQLKQDAKGINFFYKAANEPKWGNAKMTSGFESTLLTAGFKCSVGFAYGNEFVILDEPDAKASEGNAIKFFKTIANITDFKQIFTVTHRPNAKDYLLEQGANIYEVKNGVFERSI